MSDFNSFEAYYKVNPFYLTTYKINNLSDNNSSDANSKISDFYFIASKTISLSDYNSYYIYFKA